VDRVTHRQTAPDRRMGIDGEGGQGGMGCTTAHARTMGRQPGPPPEALVTSRSSQG
jgi:hypothetical protein